MRQLSTAIQTALNASVLTFSYCWLIQRKDGLVLGFTSSDVPLTIDGITYASHSGFNPTAASEVAGLTINNLELSSFFDDGGITEQDILANLYDSARVKIFLVDYTNPPTSLATTDYILLVNGVIGNITKTNLTYKAELRGLTQYLSQSLSAVTSTTCRYQLGDSRCTINLAAFTSTGSVTAVSSRRVFTISTSQADGYYEGGVITFTSGLNAGLKADIQSHASNVISLFQLAPYPIAPSDTYSISAGCNKTIETCRDKFSNSTNIGSEPFVGSPSDYLFGKISSN